MNIREVVTLLFVEVNKVNKKHMPVRQQQKGIRKRVQLCHSSKRWIFPVPVTMIYNKTLKVHLSEDSL